MTKGSLHFKKTRSLHPNLPPQGGEGEWLTRRGPFPTFRWERWGESCPSLDGRIDGRGKQCPLIASNTPSVFALFIFFIPERSILE